MYKNKFVMIAVGLLLAFALHAEIVIGEASKKCYDCHKKETPEVVRQWSMSKHAQEGVGCLNCHDPKIYKKTIISDRCQSSTPVSAIVTPAACSNCHEKEVMEYEHTKHANTLHFVVNILKDPWLVKGANSTPERATGCFMCHGSIIKDKLTWYNYPNNGVGRINPDGTRGTCTSCHNKHIFSVKEAKAPTTCGYCHLGPDHPQVEIWEESLHGKMYMAGYTKDAPTCATCHTSEVKDPKTGEVVLEATHDVGQRMWLELKPPKSTIWKDPVTWKPMDETVRKQHRENMKKVCLQCHTERHVEDYFTRIEKQVEDYNKNYFAPAKKMLVTLRKKKLLTPRPFDEEFEWDFWLLWHHEGRRMRMGASMMGPDYAWWHGAHEVKMRFMKLKRDYDHLIKLGHPDPHKYIPGATYSCGGTNLVPGVDVPDLRKK